MDVVFVDAYGDVQIAWCNIKTKGGKITAFLKTLFEQGEEGELTVYVLGSTELMNVLKSESLNSVAMKHRLVRASNDEVAMRVPCIWPRLPYLKPARTLRCACAMVLSAGGRWHRLRGHWPRLQRRHHIVKRAGEGEGRPLAACPGDDGEHGDGRRKQDVQGGHAHLHAVDAHRGEEGMSLSAFAAHPPWRSRPLPLVMHLALSPQ